MKSYKITLEAKDGELTTFNYISRCSMDTMTKRLFQENDVKSVTVEINK